MVCMEMSLLTIITGFYHQSFNKIKKEISNENIRLHGHGKKLTKLVPQNLKNLGFHIPKIWQILKLFTLGYIHM